MCIWIANIDVKKGTRHGFGTLLSIQIELRYMEIHTNFQKQRDLQCTHMCRTLVFHHLCDENTACCYTMMMKSDTTTMRLVCCTLGLLVTANLKVLAALDGLHGNSLACVALQPVWRGAWVCALHEMLMVLYQQQHIPQNNLLGGLCLFVKHGFGLTTETRLLAIVTSLALCVQRRLTSLVLCRGVAQLCGMQCQHTCTCNAMAVPHKPG